MNKTTKIIIIVTSTLLGAVVAYKLAQKKIEYYFMQNEPGKPIQPTKSTLPPIPTWAQHAARTVVVKSSIEKKMLGYKKFGTHYPSDFIIRANDKVVFHRQDKEIIPQNPQKIRIKDNTINLRYDYRFSGYRQGAKVIVFDVEPQAKELDLTFEWKDDWRILVAQDNATPRSGYEVEPSFDVSTT